MLEELRQIHRAVSRYFIHYMLDEADSAENTVCGETQHEDAVAVKEALTTLSRLIEQAEAMPEGWRPIESAPKTGATIIGFGTTPHAKFPHVGVMHWYKPYNRWEWDAYLGDMPNQPTHWMHHPQPPAKRGE